MDIDGHGGGCCGVVHISGFYSETQGGVDNLKSELSHFPDSWFEFSCEDGCEVSEEFNGYDFIKRVSDKKFSCILEACLTDGQMMFWAPHMKEAGFKIVNRFLNSNSGNVVNILHYNPAGRRKIGKAPYKW